MRRAELPLLALPISNTYILDEDDPEPAPVVDPPRKGCKRDAHITFAR